MSKSLPSSDVSEYSGFAFTNPHTILTIKKYWQLIEVFLITMQ